MSDIATPDPFIGASDNDPFAHTSDTTTTDPFVHGSDTTGLQQVRSDLATELSDPDLAYSLYQLTHNEVGSQGSEAQQAFIETVFNRAKVRDKSLADTINDRKYYPAGSYTPLPESAAHPERISEYQNALKSVLGGSNISQFATGNASGNVGFGGGPQTATFGGEKFGIEYADINKEASQLPAQSGQGDTEDPFGKVPSGAQPAIPLPQALAGAPQAFPEAMPDTLPEPDQTYFDLLSNKEGGKPLMNVTPDQVLLASRIVAPNITKTVGLNPMLKNAETGLSRSTASLITGFTTPNNITLLGTMAVAPELVGGQFIARAASLGFSAASAKNVWDSLPSLKENPGSPEWWQHFGDVVYNAGMTAVGGVGLFRKGAPTGVARATPPVPVSPLQAIENAIHSVTDSTVVGKPVTPQRPPKFNYQYRKLNLPFIPAGKGLTRTPMERWIGNRDDHLQVAEHAASEVSKAINAAVPKLDRRVAIYNWAAAGGDDAVLQRWESSAAPDTKAGYTDARNLTQAEKNVGLKVREGYDQWFTRAHDLGMLDGGLTNYLKRVVVKRPGAEPYTPYIGFKGDSLKSGQFKEAQRRFWDEMVAAEKEGVRYNKDLAATTAVYGHSLGTTAVAREAARQLFDMHTDTGRPSLIVEGNAIPVDGGSNTGLLVSPYGVREFPGQKTEIAKIKAVNPTWSDAKVKAYARDRIRQEYVSQSQLNISVPALRDWQWVHTTNDGQNILVKGDALIHKSIAPLIERKFATKRWEALDKYLLDYVNKIKGSKLSLSAFHDVHERINAASHLVNSANLRPLTEYIKMPEIREGMRNGLKVYNGRLDSAMLGEGAAAHGWVEDIPGVGKWFAAYKDFLFENQIPRMKAEAYLGILRRNKSRYPALNEEQVARLSVKESEATFGERNYRQAVGKFTGDPRFWQAMQGFFLAPDFGISKMQHIGQVFTPYGGEQRQAIAATVATLYTGARVLNQLLDNDPHFEKDSMFSVVVGDRRYSVRSIPGDMMHLFNATGNYAYYRLSPAMQIGIESIFKRDYNGRPIGYADIAKDILLAPVPIALASMAEKVLHAGSQIILGEPFGKTNRYEMRDAVAQVIGLSPSIYRDENVIKGLAIDWKKNQPATAKAIAAQQGYVNPPSKYNDLRNALANDDFGSARSEYNRLLSEGGKVTERYLDKQMKTWSNAPFATGSKAMEKDFLDTLTARDRQRYDATILQRQRVYENFQRLQ